MSLTLPSLRAPTRAVYPAAPPPWWRHRPAAFGLAGMAHIALISLFIFAVARPLAVPVEPAGFALLLAPGTTPAPAAAAAKPPPPAQPLAATPPMPDAETALAMPAPIRRPPALHHLAARAQHAAPQPDLAAATPASAARAAPALPGPAPAPRADNAALFAALEAQIDRAVQRAAVMPAAALRQHREGRARVAFTYADGAVDAVRLAESSQSRLLDDAALRAVRGAQYPSLPAGLRGARMTLLVWIEFRLQAGSSG